MKRLTLKPLVLAAALSLAQFASLGAQAAEVEIQVGPVTEAVGSLLVAIYNSAATFRKDAVQQQKITAKPGVMSLKFSDLAPGEYAIALYHDANDNGKLDTNLLGIPKEAYGFSVLDKSLLGPPSWDEVKFAIPAAGGKLTISLRN